MGWEESEMKDIHDVLDDQRAITAICIIAIVVVPLVLAVVLQYDSYTRCLNGLQGIPLDSPWRSAMESACVNAKPWWWIW